MPSRLGTLALALCVALLAPAGAQAKTVRDLWATVNLCDTAGSPNTIGVRASMPGNASNQRMYMHFEAQFYSVRLDRFLATGSSTRWMRVGSAKQESVQSGFSFEFAPPPAGEQFVMRGKVGFRWTAKRRGRYRVVRSTTRVTHAGFKGVEGGDPRGSSRSLCVIT
jgi:hypothetical protein